MNSKKIVFSASALMLAVAGVFAVRANTKAIAAHLFVSTAAGGCLQVNASSVAKFTTIGVNQATIRTTSGGSEKMWATNACSGTGAKAVYYKG